MATRFRQLIFFALGVFVALELVVWFYVPSDPLRAEFYSFDGSFPIFDGDLVSYFFLIVARLLILVGLLQFHATARLLFLVLTVATIVLQFLWGYRVTPPLIAALSYVAILIDGAIIALAYHSPVSLQFTKFPSNPSESSSA